MAAANTIALISPTYPASKISPGTFDDWVDVYEDRLWGWHFAHAMSLAQSGFNAWFVILNLSVTFIEGYEVFRTGESSKGKSKKFFQAGFWRIFSQCSRSLDRAALDQVSAAIYTQLRCGLFHIGAPIGLVFLRSQPDPIELTVNEAMEVRQINIDPVRFLHSVVHEFQTFVSRLRDPTDPEAATLRGNFERAWHLIHAS